MPAAPCLKKLYYRLFFFFFSEILSASLKRYQKLLQTPQGFREDDALKKLHYVNAFGLNKFCAFMLRLPTFIAEHPGVIVMFS